ncbi:hypothetical protein EYF80_049496 [Liparis tanakae]|uniref:Uncharacterized protein n=1 Tax=Liparis tanakae TaxID=230148 RepID=A0A4Z2FHV3_9TELE|nr:hypothetical protein EYF80_049496 [Liparis tanakae]
MEEGEGVCCEVTGEVPEEERERRLSAAKGTFLKREESILKKALGGDGRSERQVCQGPLESLRLPRHWKADRRLPLPPPRCGEEALSWGQVLVLELELELELVLEAENRRWRWWSLEPWRREARGERDRNGGLSFSVDRGRPFGQWGMLGLGVSCGVKLGLLPSFPPGDPSPSFSFAPTATLARPLCSASRTSKCFFRPETARRCGLRPLAMPRYIISSDSSVQTAKL